MRVWERRPVEQRSVARHPHDVREVEVHLDRALTRPGLQEKVRHGAGRTLRHEAEGERREQPHGCHSKAPMSDVPL